MSSSQAVRSSKYSYRATSTGPGAADINIEYTADLAALSRLEVRPCTAKSGPYSRSANKFANYFQTTFYSKSTNEQSKNWI